MVDSVSRLIDPRLAVAAALLFAVTSTSAQPVTQPFTFSIVPHTLPHVNHGTVALGDYDEDGDLDVFVSGIEEDRILTALFRNEGTRDLDGSSTFVFEDVAVGFPKLVFGSAAWGDYDNDGDLDLVVTGSRSIKAPYEPVSLLYRNDDGTFRDAGAPFEGYHSGPATWADYDNDGDLDVLLGGERADGSSEARLYRNDDGTFADSELDLPGLAYGDAEWGDIEGDGDLDLVLGGISADGTFTDIFRNHRDAFEPLNAGMADAAFADLDFGDYDGDGDPDVIQTGGQFSPELLDGFTQIYTNSRPAFDPMDDGLPGALSGAGAWGDYDSDGDLDLFVMGAEDLFGPRTARLFANEAGTLSEKSHLVGVVFGSATWGDIEGDGDLDLIASGLPTFDTPFINIYENRRQVIPPISEPVQLDSEVSAGMAVLRWHPAAEIAATYNVRVGSSPGAGDIISPMSDPGTGRRLLSAPGNAQQNLSRILKDLPVGTYYWSVQALDPAFRASRFAPEGRFTISQATSTVDPDGVLPIDTKLYSAVPNPAAGPVTLRYDLAQQSSVLLRIHDLLGRRIVTIVDGEQKAGSHRVVWDGRGAGGIRVSSGVYICSMQAGSVRHSTTLIISR